MPKVVSLDISQIHDVQAQVDTLKKTHHAIISDWQLEIISAPRLCYSEDFDPIWVLGSQGQISKINESSLLVNSLANQYEHACLLFIDCALVELPEIQELVGKI